MGGIGIPLQSAQNPPDEDMLAMLGLHPAQMQVAHGLASGTIHPQQVLDAATPKPPLQAAENQPPQIPGIAPEHTAPIAAAPVSQPAVSAPPPPVLSGMSAMPRIAPQESVAPPTRLTEDQAKLAHDTSSGSGLEQFQQRHHILGGIARVAAGIGSAAFPTIAAQIPGTDLHHQVVLNHDRQAVGQDLGEQEKEATTAEAQARTPLIEAQTRQANAAADAAGQPKPKEESWQPFPNFTDKDGTPLIHEANSGQVVRASDHQPASGFIAAKPEKPEKQTFQEQSYDEWHQSHPNGTRVQFDKELKEAERTPRNPTDREEWMNDHPGEPIENYWKAKKGASPDETRRSDLARNLNENFDQLEEIVSRRPELFGPISGRWAELKNKFGSDDPDIGALQTIEHQIGMAQISAHGMRSAQGVGSAADSIMNKFHSGPGAIMGAISAARKSVGTFQNDAGEAEGSAPKGTPAGGPKVGTVEGGYKFKGGDPADQKNWEKVKSGG